MRINNINTSVTLQPANAQPANAKRPNGTQGNITQLVELAIQKKGIRGDINMTEDERRSQLQQLEKLSDPINQTIEADQAEKLTKGLVESIKETQTEIENANKPVEGEEVDAAEKPDAANAAAPTPAPDASQPSGDSVVKKASADGAERASSLGQNIDTHA